MTDLPVSEHFKLEQLADGVWAAMALPGKGAGSNSGIIDLGDATLVLDTMNTVMAGTDLRTAAEQLTGRPPSYVVITHAHGDHWIGNQHFPEASIIATQRTRELMQPWAEYYDELREDTSEYEGWVDETRQQLADEQDPVLRDVLETRLGSLQYSLESLPQLKPTLPDLLFDTKLGLHGSGRRVELVTYGVGHTESDAVLLLPDDRIAFIGDLGFFQSHAFMASSDPAAWVKVLQQLEVLDLGVVVPGHGPLGSVDDIVLQRQYLTAAQAMAAEVIQAGGTADDAAALSPRPPFDSWTAGIFRFPDSMRFLHKRLSE